MRVLFVMFWLGFFLCRSVVFFRSSHDIKNHPQSHRPLLISHTRMHVHTYTQLNLCSAALLELGAKTFWPMLPGLPKKTMSAWTQAKSVLRHLR